MSKQTKQKKRGKNTKKLNKITRNEQAKLFLSPLVPYLPGGT
jgi:hypothetical protein